MACYDNVDGKKYKRVVTSDEQITDLFHVVQEYVKEICESYTCTRTAASDIAKNRASDENLRPLPAPILPLSTGKDRERG